MQILKAININKEDGYFAKKYYWKKLSTQTETLCTGAPSERQETDSVYAAKILELRKCSIFGSNIIWKKLQK